MWLHDTETACMYSCMQMFLISNIIFILFVSDTLRFKLKNSTAIDIIKTTISPILSL